MKIVKYGDGASARPHEDFLIANSARLFIGGAVKLSSGKLEALEANDAMYGICVGFVGKGNAPVSSVTHGGSYTSGVEFTAASDNETDAGIRAKVVPVMPNDVIRMEGDSSTATTASTTIGNYVAVPTGGAATANVSKFEVGAAVTAYNSATGSQFLITDVPSGPGNFVDAKLIKGQIFGRHSI